MSAVDGGAGEGDGAGEQPVEHAAERVDVGPRVHRPGLDLLGRGVVERGQDGSGPGQPRGAVQGLGDAEVGQEDLLGPVVAVRRRRQQDVGRLDVAVDQVVAVGAVERRRRLGDDVHDPVGREAAGVTARSALDVDAVDVLHGQPELTGVLAAVEDGHDVAVGQAGHDVGLVQEAGGEVRVDRELRPQQLQRVQPREARMPDQVDRAHAAAAQLAEHRVPGEDVARSERHGSLLGRVGRC